MIKIRNDNEPAYLTSDVVEASKVKIREQVNNGEQKLSIPNHWSDTRSDNTIKDVLFDMHHRKCCYCERERTRKREMDVEHYRPKAKVDSEADHLGYWWLAYDWDNYLWSCKSCNQEHKKNQFPLLPDGVRAKKEGDGLPAEKPCLINPRFDEPSDYLAYYRKKLGGRWFVRVIALPGLSEKKKQRGEETIRILGLNRVEIGDDMVSERGELLSGAFLKIVYGLIVAEHQLRNAVELEIIRLYEKKVSEFKERLKRFVHPNKSFAGLFRYILTEHEIDYSNLVEE